MTVRTPHQGPTRERASNLAFYAMMTPIVLGAIIIALFYLLLIYLVVIGGGSVVLHSLGINV